MSRITGADAAKMMEAYAEVYAPDEEVIELTEEQIQEDFENWVYSLVEEGYDLSEYTWEDMYEHYLNEAPVYDMGSGLRQQMQRNIQSRTSIGPGGFRFNNRPIQTRPTQSPTYSTLNQPGVQNRFIQDRRPAPAPARPAPTAAARPTAAPTRPAPAAPARPVQGSPRQASTPAPAPTSTQSPVLGYQLAQRGTNIGSNILQQQRPSLAQQAAELRAMRQASQQRQGLTQSFNPFDVVMGYLIDEGYAESEEAATVIMANMSEEWKEEIIEGFMNQEN